MCVSEGERHGGRGGRGLQGGRAAEGRQQKESKRHAATGTGFLSPGAAFCAAIVDQSNTF